MEIWHAFVLGLVQGLAEFLPISSSGHLVFLQKVLGVDIGEAELFFDIILHMGTLVAVCAVFWKDIINLFKKPFKTLLYLIVATIPAGVAGILFEYFGVTDSIIASKYIGIILACFFLFTAALLYATEVYAKRRTRTLPLSFKTTLPMGFAQVVALFPGISRSGSTIAAGTFAGADSEDVSRFSFLMSIPVILGSFVVSLFSGIKNGTLQNSFVQAGSNIGWCIAIGFIVSAISGLFAIRVMLNAIKKANYKWFSLYLVCLSVACVILHCTGCFY
jgi:undecaprenyl-diphosphatase